MKYKNYKDEIKESNFGVILEGENIGKPSYIEHPEIKEVEIDGEWVANEGYNIETIKQKIKDEIKRNISFKLDLLIYSTIDNIIANESNTKVKAILNLMKQASINNLQEIKTKIIDET